MWKIASKEEKLLDLFNTMAENANDTARLLSEMMEGFDRLQERALAIQGKEHLGDSQIDDLLTRLDSSVIAAADRQDIQQLASAIDDIIDLSDSAASKLAVFDHHEKIPGAPELARVLRRQTQELAWAMQALSQPERVRERCTEVRRLEREADAIFRQAIGRAFLEERDPIRIIKIKGVLESIEAAIDTCKDAANALQATLVRSGGN